MDAFKLVKNGKVLDYRLGEKLDLQDVRSEFEKEFDVVELKQDGRHVVGVLKHDNHEYILKLATTEGVSARTEIDKLWNDEFNRYSTNPKLRVPKNLKDGYYKNLYYIIEEKFDGPLICKMDGSLNLLPTNIEAIINFSELIQTLPIDIPNNDLISEKDHKAWFVAKTKSWLDAIPSEIRDHYEVEQLFEIAKDGAEALEEKPRHGDFTPWHLISLMNGGLGLIDGEHAHSQGVEYYDICYFIQRVYSIIDEPEQAVEIFSKLINRGYDKQKIKTVLASRAIGGFLDESLNPNGDYKSEEEFKKWVQEL